MLRGTSNLYDEGGAAECDRPRPALTVSLAWIHPPTHPAIAKLVTLAREVTGYRPPGAT
jgi:hypothetical protein